MRILLSSVFLAIMFMSCTSHRKKLDITILPVSKVSWEKLNPARGDKSPRAGTLWGNRKGSPETGFLAKFVNGFSSPPHIHNVSYRAIVIEGLIHNDDPKASVMWMPKESYWTQPAGEPHITSAKGKTNIALVEIDNGPYLVKPIRQKFDNGEHPYNIHSSNIIWNDKGSYKSVDLWKNKANIVTGSLLQFSDKLKLISSSSKIVIISGSVFSYKNRLNPGSLISIGDKTQLKLLCESKDCTIYLKTINDYRVL